MAFCPWPPESLIRRLPPRPVLTAACGAHCLHSPLLLSPHPMPPMAASSVGRSGTQAVAPLSSARTARGGSGSFSMGSSLPSPILEVTPTGGAWVPPRALMPSPHQSRGASELLGGGLVALGCFLPLNSPDVVTI